MEGTVWWPTHSMLGQLEGPTLGPRCCYAQGSFLKQNWRPVEVSRPSPRMAASGLETRPISGPSPPRSAAWLVKFRSKAR